MWFLSHETYKNTGFLTEKFFVVSRIRFSFEAKNSKSFVLSSIFTPKNEEPENCFRPFLYVHLWGETKVCLKMSFLMQILRLELFGCWSSLRFKVRWCGILQSLEWHRGHHHQASKILRLQFDSRSDRREWVRWRRLASDYESSNCSFHDLRITVQWDSCIWFLVSEHFWLPSNRQRSICGLPDRKCIEIN